MIHDGCPVCLRVYGLPECPGCQRPVAKATAARTGGVCSACLPLFPEAFARAAERAAREQQQRQEAAIRRREAEAARAAWRRPRDELAERRARRRQP